MTKEEKKLFIDDIMDNIRQDIISKLDKISNRGKKRVRNTKSKCVDGRDKRRNKSCRRYIIK